MKRRVLVPMIFMLVIVMLVSTSINVDALKTKSTDTAAKSVSVEQTTRVFLPFVVHTSTRIGTEGNPIKVLFVPSVDRDFMIAAGDLIEQDLKDQTGLFFEVSVPASYADTIEGMCASPGDTVGFIPAVGYVLANDLCGVEPGLSSVRYGWNVYWAQFLVARDSEIQTFEDLEGASWAYPDETSTSGYLYPMAIFDNLGINLGDMIDAGSHPQVVKAVYNGEVEFGTTYFSPPIPPEGTWSMDMDPDIPDDLVDDCTVDAVGTLMCGGWRVLDARSSISTEVPDVVQEVRILDLSPEIPNDTMSFSPEFPDGLKQVVIDAIVAYAESEACLETLCNEKFYDWTGAAPITDANFYGVRLLVEYLNLTLDDL